MAIQVQPVIMAGGSGTRLWPLSRSGFPKQFLAIDGRTSLFQQAVERLAALNGNGITAAAPLVVGNDEHRFLLLEQLREQGITNATIPRGDDVESIDFERAVELLADKRAKGPAKPKARRAPAKKR